MISAFWFLGSKIKIGRSPGLRPPGGRLVPVDQGDLFPREPRGLSKVEWNRTFSPNFFLNAKWAYYSTGFTLGARDGRANDQVYDRVHNEARGNANSSTSCGRRTPSSSTATTSSAGMGGNHELKFGASWKKTQATHSNDLLRQQDARDLQHQRPAPRAASSATASRTRSPSTTAPTWATPSPRTG